MVARVVEQTSKASRVPVPSTPLLGREQELGDIVGLLSDDDTRIVTLLGPGGVGKTRLAVAVASELESMDPGSVFLVSVAHVRSRADLLAEIAEALGVREQAGSTLLESISFAFRDHIRLLVVDNLEQIPDAGIDLAAILAADAGLTLLATSRSPLRISGERRYRIDPLPVVANEDDAAAVQLFVDRANLAGPFDITAANRESVRAICQRLDGLPLAIELAAARIRTLSPDALLARLTSRLTPLRSGTVDQPERHQTLQATISWSVDLLSEAERRTFCRFAAIPGGFDLPLAAAVTELDEDAATTLIEVLLDQSLLTTTPGNAEQPRFGMLQTIRDFGLNESAMRGDLDATRAALAAHVLARAPKFRAGLVGTEAPIWRAWCTRERANIAASLEWFIEQRDAAAATELAGALWRFWYDGGYYREGITWLERVVDVPGPVEPREAANVLNGLGALHFGMDDDIRAATAFDRAIQQWELAGDATGLANTIHNRALLALERGEYPTAIDGFERAIELVRQIGDRRRLAIAQDNLGLVYETIGEHARAAELHASSIAASRVLGDEPVLATASHHLSSALLSLGEIDAAVARSEEARAIWERIGDRSQLAYCLNTLGILAERRGDPAAADERYSEALGLWRELETPRGISLALHNLGKRALDRGELGRAEELLRESLTIRRVRANPLDLAYSISAIAGLALACGQPERATQLAAWSRRCFEQHGVPPNRGDDRPELRRAIGKARFDSAWKTGSNLSLEEVLAEIEHIAPPQRATSVEYSKPAAIASPAVTISSATNADHGLTARELDVLRLVATGKTNAEIGEALFISPFTAKTHVANLLGKLGVESRAAASTWAAQHSLI